MFRGVYKLKDRLLLVLDAERTVDLSAGRTANAFSHASGKAAEDRN